MGISRRRFAELTGTAILVGRPGAGQSKTVTAQQVVDRIQKNVGVPWRPDSLDTFKAGDPSTPLTGIATTAMATMDVLSRAVKEKANLVITLEPTYFGRLDGMPGAAAAGRGQAGPAPDDESPVQAITDEYRRWRAASNGPPIFWGSCVLPGIRLARFSGRIQQQVGQCDYQLPFLVVR
jgi:NIF3 (NGG1p interacting factor 3)